MSTPKCPICGATSTWINFPESKNYYKPKYPDKCSRCKADEGRWEKEHQLGIDVVDQAGRGRTLTDGRQWIEDELLQMHKEMGYEAVSRDSEMYDPFER